MWDAHYVGPERRTALHAAAVVLNSEGFTQELLKKHPTLIKMVDNFGWTALHYAARYGSDNVVKELLKMDKSIAYVVAEEGDNMTALHLATCEGNVEIMREILIHCPDCWEMVTGDGHNNLHLALKFEEEKATKFILKQSWVGNLINQKDAEGNTPLHIYATTNNLKGVDLVNHLQADPNVVNKEQMTPLDVVVHSDIFSIVQDNIEKELKRKSTLVGIWNPLNRDYRSQKMKEREERKRDMPMDLRKMGDTQMIVAALIMTVTFAAGFTIPGGYKENDGHAIFSRNYLFIVFVIADTLAVVLSASALSLYMVAAMFSSRQSILQRYYTATILVQVAMCCTIIAFFCGLLVVIEGIVPLVLIECIAFMIWVRFFGYIRLATHNNIGSMKNL